MNRNYMFGFTVVLFLVTTLVSLTYLNTFYVPGLSPYHAITFSIFSHSSIFHYLSNILSLLLFVGWFEYRYGTSKTFTMFSILFIFNWLYLFFYEYNMYYMTLKELLPGTIFPISGISGIIYGFMFAAAFHWSSEIRWVKLWSLAKGMVGIFFMVDIFETLFDGVGKIFGFVEPPSDITSKTLKDFIVADDIHAVGVLASFVGIWLTNAIPDVSWPRTKEGRTSHEDARSGSVQG